MQALKVIVIGAGAAGMMAAAQAARSGAHVTLLEKNSKTGVKILMSGGTRCNITHHTDAKGILAGFGKAGRFLQPSVGAFPPRDVVDMFESLGVATKVEDTGKVFPVSDRAIEVRDALHRQAVDAGVQILMRQAVASIAPNQDGWTIRTETDTFEADRLIVTSGGRSWPGCGTTGDAYAWLSELGHTITRLHPALVPLVGGTPWTQALSGITVDDVRLSVYPADAASISPRTLVDTRRASMLLTHMGLSGPAPMDVSGALTEPMQIAERQLVVDWVPGSSEEELRSQLADRGGGAGRRRLSQFVGEFLPARLAAALVAQLGPDRTLGEVNKAAMMQLLADLKRMRFPITGTRGFEKAEVTAGGVALEEVNPKTMASRLHPGLFIAGEVLDVDGRIGGFNFQAAFSTGRAAGIAAASA